MKFDRHLLIRLFGFRGAFLHGDPMVADRWRFLSRHLPKTRNEERLLDIGCGSGAFTIGAARRGYVAVGLSWDERNQKTASERARICGVQETQFPIQDVRCLDERHDLYGAFDVVVNFENIEHILDDRKLVNDIALCLKPGGRLIMTAPYYYYKPLSAGDLGPFRPVEDGAHVRRGYTSGMLRELCSDSGLIVEEITTCSGFLSQQLSRMQRALGRAGWAMTLPMRWLQPIVDPLVARLTGYSGYSICMVAYKPRFLDRSALASLANVSGGSGSNG